MQTNPTVKARAVLMQLLSVLNLYFVLHVESDTSCAKTVWKLEKMIQVSIATSTADFLNEHICSAHCDVAIKIFKLKTSGIKTDSFDLCTNVLPMTCPWDLAYHDSSATVVTSFDGHIDLLHQFDDRSMHMGPQVSKFCLCSFHITMMRRYTSPEETDGASSTTRSRPEQVKQNALLRNFYSAREAVGSNCQISHMTKRISTRGWDSVLIADESGKNCYICDAELPSGTFHTIKYRGPKKIPLLHNPNKQYYLIWGALVAAEIAAVLAVLADNSFLL